MVVVGVLMIRLAVMMALMEIVDACLSHQCRFAVLVAAEGALVHSSYCSVIDCSVQMMASVVSYSQNLDAKDMDLLEPDWQLDYNKNHNRSSPHWHYQMVVLVVHIVMILEAGMQREFFHFHSMMILDPLRVGLVVGLPNHGWHLTRHRACKGS